MNDVELRRLTRSYDWRDAIGARRVLTELVRAGIDHTFLRPPVANGPAKQVAADGLQKWDVGAPLFTYAKRRAWTATGALLSAARRCRRAYCTHLQAAWTYHCGLQPISDIKPALHQVRAEPPLEDSSTWRLMLESLQEVGLVQAIMIDNRRHVVDGNFRLAACRALKWESIATRLICCPFNVHRYNVMTGRISGR